MIVAAVMAVATFGSAAVAHPDAPPVDAFGQDRNSLSGTIDEVCGPGPQHDASASRSGRVALIEYLRESFPEVEGFAGFSCREIHNRRGSCVGRAAPETSDCWSTHAAGRAIDVMVGGAGNQSGRPVGGDLGDRIVNHLLERVNGVDNYRARIMGIQQLLWNGTCWASRTHADGGVTDVSELDDDCVDDHDNHVHITLSDAGADGLTSFHTGEVADASVLEAEIVEPEVHRDNHLVLYDATDGSVIVRGLDEEGDFTEAEASAQLATGWTAIAAPDVAGNGDHEIFAYRAKDGRHAMRELREGGSLGSAVGADGGELEPGYTIVATPDVDGDGDDELLLYRADDGAWVLHELLPDGELGPALQAADAVVDVFFSAAATPDLDGDGDDELVLYRRFDGHHVVMDFDTLDGHQDADVADEVDEDAEPVDGARFDTDDDGEVDVDLALRIIDPAGEAADEGADTDDAEPADPDAVVGPDGAPIVGGLGVTLSAGFTTLAAPDLDNDGIDELVLYREGDGCLAIRRLGGLDVDDEASPDDDQDALETLPPCLVAPEDLGDTADVADDTADDDLPAVRWLVESWDTVDAGWTAGAVAAIGPEQLADGE